MPTATTFTPFSETRFMFTPSKLLSSMVLASWITLGVGLPVGGAGTVSTTSVPTISASAEGDQVAKKEKKKKKKGGKNKKGGKKKGGKKKGGKKKTSASATA
jgi:hypothetical protein